MALYKLRNGQRVEMTPEEEAEITALQSYASDPQRKVEALEKEKQSFWDQVKLQPLGVKLALYWKWQQEKADNPSLTVAQFGDMIKDDIETVRSFFGD